MVSRAALLGDGATNGTSVSASNSGRAAGLPLDSVTIGAGATLTYDTTQHYWGTGSVHVTTGATGVNVYGRWDNMFRPAGPNLVATILMRFAAIPAASTSLLFIADSSAARVAEVRCISTGKIQAYDASGTARVATATSIAVNQWVRADIFITPDAAAGKLQIVLRNSPTGAPTETTAQITGLNLRTATPSQYYVGTANSSANQNYNVQAFLSDGAPAPLTGGWVMSRWVGAVTPTSVKVNARTLGAASVRLVVSTAANLATSPAFSSSATPDADGMCSLSVTGLSAATTYFYGVEVDGVVDSEFNGTFQSFPTTGSVLNFSYGAASCARNNSNSPVFDLIRSRVGPYGKNKFFVHLGDRDYRDPTTNDQVAIQKNYDQTMSSPRQLDFFGNIPIAYLWSDHDSTGPNGDGTSAPLPATQAVYRSRVPSYSLPDANAVYFSFVYGRMEFICPDDRSYASPIAATDNASKTKFGATQKSWLKTRLADKTYPIKVLCMDDTWNNLSTYTGDDTWSAYSTERQELADYITANKVQCIWINGDLHVLAADGGGNNTWGGFPLFVCSPLDQTSYRGNGTFSTGFYPTYDSTAPDYYSQYGQFDVTDDGTWVTIAYSGIDSTGVTRVSQTVRLSAVPKVWETTFDTGVNSAAIGAGDGPGYTLTGVPTYSNAYAKNGGLSARASVASNSTVAVGTSATTYTGQDVYTRSYLLVPAYPTGANAVFTEIRDSGGVEVLAVGLTPAGKVTIGTQGNESLFTSARTVAPGQFIRVETRSNINGVSNTVDVRLNIRAPDGTTPDETYTIAAPAGSNVTALSWGAMGRSGVSAWTTHTDAVAISTTTWIGPEVPGTTTVAKPASASWKVARTVSKTAVSSFNVMRSAASSAAAGWYALSALSLQRDAGWGVRRQVTPGASSSWNVRVAVPAAHAVRWNVRAGLSISRTSRWGLAQALVKTATSVWGVRLPVVLSALANWAVREDVIAQADASWSVRQPVTRQATSQWRVIESKTATRSSGWNVRTAAVTTLASSLWKVRTPVSTQASASWKARSVVSKAVAAGWNIYVHGSGSSGLAMTWKVRSSANASAAASWRSRQTVSAVRSATWKVSGVTRVQFTCGWNVRPFVINPDIPLMPMRAPADMRAATRRLL